MEPFNIDAELAASIDQLTEEELEGLSELYRDSRIDNEIEIFIYSCFQAYKKSRLKNLLDQAILRSRDWALDTSPSHPDHHRRSDLFNMLVTWDHQYEEFAHEISHHAERTRLIAG